jgi:hypothetical protein
MFNKGDRVVVVGGKHITKEQKKSVNCSGEVSFVGNSACIVTFDNEADQPILNSFLYEELELEAVYDSPLYEALK